MQQAEAVVGATQNRVPLGGTEDLSPALQRWVAVVNEPSPVGTREGQQGFSPALHEHPADSGEQQVPPLRLKPSVGMTHFGVDTRRS